MTIVKERLVIVRKLHYLVIEVPVLHYMPFGFAEAPLVCSGLDQVDNVLSALAVSPLGHALGLWSGPLCSGSLLCWHLGPASLLSCTIVQFTCITAWHSEGQWKRAGSALSFASILCQAPGLHWGSLEYSHQQALQRWLSDQEPRCLGPG